MHHDDDDDSTHELAGKHIKALRREAHEERYAPVKKWSRGESSKHQRNLDKAERYR